MSGQHILPLRAYFGVFFGLMGLTALTTWISFIDLGAMNDVVALTIAIVKVVLVLVYFMHLRHSSKLVWIIAGSGFLWLTILFGLTLSDFTTRIPIPGWVG